MSDLVLLLVIIFLVAAEMTVMFTSNGGVRAPHCSLDWVCWLMAVLLALFVGWAAFSILPCSFDLSIPVLLLVSAFSVLLLIVLSWGGMSLSKKHGWC